MRFSHRSLVRSFVLALAGLVGLCTAVQAQAPSYLVLAPDRGFLGNDEVREVFAAFQEYEPRSALAFATHEETASNLDAALAKLEGEVVVLPFFVSTQHVLYAKARVILEERGARMAEPFGRSYLAEEVLFDRVDALSKSPGEEALVVVGYGPATGAQAEALQRELQPMVERARQKYGLQASHVAVNYDRSAPDEAAAAARAAVMRQAEETAARYERVLVVPFNLGMRYTTMMASWTWTQRQLRGVEAVVADGKGVLPHDNALRWLRRTATAYQPLATEDVGVILVPHGSDYNWNEQMRQSVAPLAEEYVVEHAFSMVDPYVVERAVRRLEARGVKAAVLVRIFSLESNFEGTARYVLGLAPEHAGGMGGRFPMRVASHLQFATLGGLEADSRFARVLLERAEALSTDPSTETVILLAHGTGDEARNDHWMDNLAVIARTMREHGGDAFRDIQHYAWREDWPALREQTIPEIRRAVEDASAGEGTAIVIPARTTGQGPAERLLEGLDFRYGSGFAPHPLFVEWLRAQVEAGIERLRAERPAAVSASASRP